MKNGLKEQKECFKMLIKRSKSWLKEQKNDLNANKRSKMVNFNPKLVEINRKTESIVEFELFWLKRLDFWYVLSISNKSIKIGFVLINFFATFLIQITNLDQNIWNDHDLIQNINLGRFNRLSLHKS